MGELVVKHLYHEACSFCGLKENNEIKYGKIYNLGSITAHYYCVQLALSEGYLFKCAICNNKKEFKKHMLRFGIFIPQRDASWELVPHAFEELLFKYNRCDAEDCKNPVSRQKSIEDTIWEIILCKSCGSQGIHIACGNLKLSNPHWECKTCTKIINTKLKESDVCNLNCPNFYRKSSEEFVKATPGSSSNTFNNFKHYRTISQNALQSKKRKMSEEESLVSEKRPKYFIDSEDSEEFVDVETVDLPEVKTKGDTSSGKELAKLGKRGSASFKGSSNAGAVKPFLETKTVEVVELTDSDDDDDDEVKVISEIHRVKKNLREEK